ncbi:MAG: hypothetical protein ACTSP7_13935 [Candidatus Heimdallarchaeota archaeon]
MPETDTNTFTADAVTVSELWTYEVGGPITSSPNIADLDKDGNYEVLLSSEDGI